MNIVEITKQYLVTALWAECDDQDNSLDNNYGLSDIPSEEIQKAMDDVKWFIALSGSLLNDLSDTDIGHNLWLTRKGHGAGFWDGDFKHGDALTIIAEYMGDVYIYVGDDNKIHLG